MNKEDVKKECLEFFKGDILATEVFLKKYSHNQEETPHDIWWRLAKEFAIIERDYIYIEDKHYEEVLDKLSEYGQNRALLFKGKYLDLDYIAGYIYDFFEDFKRIIPGGSVISGLGIDDPDNISSLANCFFNGTPEDDISSIMEIKTNMMNVAKLRGGTSVDLSKIRPRGAKICNSAKESTGIITWLEEYNTIGNSIGQKGREAATMVTLLIDHPDIEEFIEVKHDLTRIKNCNLSVKVSNEFMRAVNNDEDYLLTWPHDVNRSHITDPIPYNKLIKVDNCYIKKIRAKELWDKIIYSAWKYAEPGLLYWDTIKNYDGSSVYEELIPRGVNACSELPLSENGSCLLISANTYSLVDNPFTEIATLNEVKAYETFYEQLCLADDLVDLEKEQIDKILDKCDLGTKEWLMWSDIQSILVAGRKLGCGITGLGDFYAALGVNYGNEEITKKLFEIKLRAELDATTDLAILRGCFPLYDRDKEQYEVEFKTGYESTKSFVGRNYWYTFLNVNFSEQMERMYKYSRRNSTWSTIPPAGTISMMCETTSGIESLFEPYYTRRTKVDGDWKEYLVVHPKLKEFAKVSDKVSFEDIDNLTLKEIQAIYEASPYFNNTAGCIAWNDRVSTQALIQQYVCSAISSTVNLPKGTPQDTVDMIYRWAHQRKLKGITCYVDGSREGVLVKNVPEINLSHNCPKRPRELEAELHIVKYKKETFAIAVGLLCNKPYEVFVCKVENIASRTFKGKLVKIKKRLYNFVSEDLVIDNIGGQELDPLVKHCSLYTSMLLRHGVDIKFICDVTKKMDDNIVAFVAVMNRVLMKYTSPEILTDVCPDCGEPLIKKDGCTSCSANCGYSLCGMILNDSK